MIASVPDHASLGALHVIVGAFLSTFNPAMGPTLAQMSAALHTWCVSVMAVVVSVPSGTFVWRTNVGVGCGPPTLALHSTFALSLYQLGSGKQTTVGASPGLTGTDTDTVRPVDAKVAVTLSVPM